MLFIGFLILIVAMALHSNNIHSILVTRIAAIIFIYAGALSLNAFYIQSIGSGIGIYSGLFHVTTVSQLLDKISSVSGLNKFYAFLDSLTLFQESAVFHILLFIGLLLTVLNFLFIFFGNEVIRILKIEQRFPSLAGLIRLRTKFQRYYLMLDIFILFLLCVFGIFVNLLFLFKGL